MTGTGSNLKTLETLSFPRKQLEKAAAKEAVASCTAFSKLCFCEADSRSFCAPVRSQIRCIVLPRGRSSSWESELISPDPRAPQNIYAAIGFPHRSRRLRAGGGRLPTPVSSRP